MPEGPANMKAGSANHNPATSLVKGKIMIYSGFHVARRNVHFWHCEPKKEQRHSSNKALT